MSGTWRGMKRSLRSAVSGTRNRYKEGAYDLDLTYITPRLIAMGFPSSGVEALYRNNIDTVARMLDEYHGPHYQIYNLSEVRVFCDTHLFCFD